MIRYAAVPTTGYENKEVCVKWQICHFTTTNKQILVDASLYDTKEEAEYHIRLMEAKYEYKRAVR